MKVQLSSGNYNILASGETYLFSATDELLINLNDGENLDLKIRIRFLSDDSNRQRIESTVVDGCLVLSCFHFKDSGTGMTHPWRIANFEGKDIFILFWSYLDGQKEPRPRRIRYTIFQEQCLQEV